MVIRIKNLRLRTIIGINDWERSRKQDVIVNAELILDDPPAMQTDRLADTLDYRAASRRIIAEVEKLVIAFASRLNLCLNSGLPAMAAGSIFIATVRSSRVSLAL